MNYYELNMSKLVTIIRRFTSFQIAISLMMAQLDAKRIAECLLYNNMYINLPDFGCL